MKLEIGKQYEVICQRKGKFKIHVTSQCDTWTHGTIIGGEAQAMLDYNKRYVGDEISCRTSFIQSAKEIKVPALTLIK